MPSLFPLRRSTPTDRCEHCGELVERVWLVPGDVLNSCADCFSRATGRRPVHEQGHSSAPPPPPAALPRASFYLRTDGRRPA